jgi:large subunit ribosomal protein L5
MADKEDKQDRQGKQAPEQAAAAEPAQDKPQDKPKKDRGDKGKKGKGDKGKGETNTGGTAPAEGYKRTQPPRLRRLYDGEIKAKLMKELGYKNVNQVPRLVKISVNMGLGAATQNAKVIESGVAELRLITGQNPVVTTARKDIANFKLRTGVKIGAMVTLRAHTMWEFLDRLVNIALPRVRDFKGVSDKAFDGRGNFTLGVREQIIFPEIEYDDIDAVKGLNITIVTTARTDDEARALLGHLGMPFRQRAKDAAAA